MRTLALLLALLPLGLGQVRIPGPGGPQPSAIGLAVGTGTSAAASSNVTTLATTGTVNAPVGTVVFVQVGFNAACSSRTFNCTDNASTPNTYTAIGALNSQSFLCSQVFYSKITTGNATDTVTCNIVGGSGEFMNVAVLPVTGTSATPLDAGPASAGAVSGGTPASASFTTTTANEVLVAGWIDFYGADTVGVSAPWILGTGTQSANGSGPSAGIEYKIVSTTQTGITAPFAVTGTGYSNIAVGTFHQ